MNRVKGRKDKHVVAKVIMFNLVIGRFNLCVLNFSSDGRTGPGPSSEEEGLYSLRMAATYPCYNTNILLI